MEKSLWAVLGIFLPDQGFKMYWRPLRVNVGVHTDSVRHIRYTPTSASLRTIRFGIT